MKFKYIILFDGNFSKFEDFLLLKNLKDEKNIFVIIASQSHILNLKSKYDLSSSFELVNDTDFYCWLLSYKDENPRLFISDEAGFPNRTLSHNKVNEYLNLHPKINIYSPLFNSNDISDSDSIDDFPFKLHRQITAGSKHDLLLPCAMLTSHIFDLFKQFTQDEYECNYQSLTIPQIKTLLNQTKKFSDLFILSLFTLESTKFANDKSRNLSVKFWLTYKYNKYLRFLKYFIEIYTPTVNILYRKIQIYFKK